MWKQPVDQYQPTDSQLSDWLDEENAFLDQIEFDAQSQNRETGPSINRYSGSRDEASHYIALPQASFPAHHSQRSTSEIPAKYQSIFKFKYFNQMQTEAMDKLLYSDDNIVISAPTGTGKTALLEMAMIRCLSLQRPEYESAIKMIYMAPTRSLCSEKVKEWSAAFDPLGISCHEFTGDSDYATVETIRNSNIIVTTPEKWDSMTRRWIDHRRLFELIKLFMIDEIHILKEARGSILEVCVSRMKTLKDNLRFVAISATIPNLQDMMTWLNASSLTFSEEYRPIRLERFVYGYPLKGENYFAFEKSLDWKLLDIIMKHGDDKPVLVFCTTRGATQSACETLLKLMASRNISFGASGTDCRNKKLFKYMQSGIAFHHAGLDAADRHLVERMFSNRLIRVVATTSTLAVGVNLPAHLVIIKSTKRYHNGLLEEYSDIDILQMMGRAGRPGLDTSGCAVIMTTSNMELKFKLLISCQSTIESSLHQNLTEHLMSEVCIGTVVDLKSSVKWLESTFLYTRIHQNPSHYQLLCSDATMGKNPDQIMQDICIKDMKILTDNGLATVSGSGSNATYSATFYGTTMDRYYLLINTMINIMKHYNWNSIKDVLELVSQAEEFKSHRYNANEKRVLNELRSDAAIRFPLKSKVSSTFDKVFLMIQCILGDVTLYHQSTGATLSTEGLAIMRQAIRVAKCIVDCAAYEKNPSKLKHSLELYQSLQAKIWSTSPFILRQIDGIGTQLAKGLSQNNISNFDQLRLCDPGQLDMIAHRNAPFGTKVKNALSAIPQYYLEMKQTGQRRYCQQRTIELSVTVCLTNQPSQKSAKFEKGFYTILWIETSDHLLVDFRRIVTRHLLGRSSEYTFRVRVTSPSMLIICHLQNEDYVGLDILKKLKPDVDPTEFITLTEPKIHDDPPVSSAAQDNISEDDENYEVSLDDWKDIVEVLDKNEDAEDKSRDTQMPPSSTRIKRKPSVTAKEGPCKHQCKDKTSCKHQCCKRGQTVKDQRSIAPMMISGRSSNEIRRIRSRTDRAESSFTDNDSGSIAIQSVSSPTCTPDNFSNANSNLDRLTYNTLKANNTDIDIKDEDMLLDSPMSLSTQLGPHEANDIGIGQYDTYEKGNKTDNAIATATAAGPETGYEFDLWDIFDDFDEMNDILDHTEGEKKLADDNISLFDQMSWSDIDLGFQDDNLTTVDGTCSNTQNACNNMDILPLQNTKTRLVMATEAATNENSKDAFHWMWDNIGTLIYTTVNQTPDDVSISDNSIESILDLTARSKMQPKSFDLNWNTEYRDQLDANIITSSADIISPVPTTINGPPRSSNFSAWLQTRTKVLD